MLSSALRILVVEDEPLISMMIEQMVADLGGTVAGRAGSCDEALSQLGGAPLDAALLDVNLGTETSERVADACRTQGIPIVFTTAYTVRDLPRFCGDSPILAKPFSNEDFETVLGRLFNGRQQP